MTSWLRSAASALGFSGRGKRAAVRAEAAASEDEETNHATDSEGMAIERAEKETAQYASLIAIIRNRAETSAKAIGGIGGAAVAAVGYENLTDVFPYSGPWWALVMLLTGGVALAAVVILMVRRFYRASQVVLTYSDPKRMEDPNKLTCKELEEVRDAFARVADRHGWSSLDSYEKEGRRLEREADEATGEEAAALRRRSLRIISRVDAAHMRIAALILRRRATKALYGNVSLAAYAVFALAWFSMAIGADKIEGQRTDAIEIAKECAEARESGAVVEAKLPAICGEPTEPGSPGATDEEAGADGAEEPGEAEGAP